MQLKWTSRALQQFGEAIDYIAKENPIAAQTIAQRVADALELLLSSPKIGHAGRIPGTREWIVRKTPYIVAYRIEAQELWVLRLIPAKQDPAKLLHH